MFSWGWQGTNSRHCSQSITSICLLLAWSSFQCPHTYPPPAPSSPVPPRGCSPSQFIVQITPELPIPWILLYPHSPWLASHRPGGQFISAHTSWRKRSSEFHRLQHSFTSSPLNNTKPSTCELSQGKIPLHQSVVDAAITFNTADTPVLV